MLLCSGKTSDSSTISAATIIKVKSFRCPRCNLHFPEKKLVFNHTQEEHPKCKQCRKIFLDTGKLQTHQQTTEHCYCCECDIYFTDLAEHVTHVRSVTHTTLHHCCDCYREYTNQDTLSHHCCDCDEIFRSQKRMKKHLSKMKHMRKVEVLEPEKARNLPHKCKECDEAFHRKKQLNKHISSSHKPPRHIQCPIGKRCKKFATPSALLNHLESGRCSSGITRTKIHELIFAHDTNRYITSVEVADTIYCAENLPGNEPSPVPLLTDDDSLSEWSVVGGGLLTPTTSDSEWSIIGRNTLTPVHGDHASEGSFINEDRVRISSNTFPSDTNLDISSYSDKLQEQRCYTCGLNRKPFRTVMAYQEHIRSAAHAPKVFHCPFLFMPKVNQKGLAKIRYFSTLGGLMQHMESGRCVGGLKMYSKAIFFVEEQLKSLGFSDFMLLSK
ncbi:hypothetical protein ACMFMG_012121 [Clarireedia jacksonii]